MTVRQIFNNIKKYFSQKGPLYILLVSIMFLPLANIIWFIPVKDSLVVAISDTQLSYAENLKLHTNLLLGHMFESMDSTAQEIAVETNIDKVEKVLDQYLKSEDLLSKMIYVDKQGEEILQLERFGDEHTADESAIFDESLFTGALHGEIVISNPYLQNGLNPVMDLYIPVKSADETVGVIVGTVNFQIINNVFEDFRNSNSNAYLIDNTGLVLAHSNHSMVGKNSNVLNRPIVSAILNGKKLSNSVNENIYFNEKGVEVFATGAMFENGWAALVEVDENIVFKKVHTIRNIAFAITAVMYFFAFVVVFLILRVRKAREDLELVLVDAQKLAAIVENSFEAIMIVGANDGHYEYVNKAWEGVTGWSREEVVGKESPRILNSGKHPKELFEKMWKKIMTGETYVGEMINKKKDGTLFNTEVVILPIKDSNGTIVYYAEISRDITERKKADLDMIRQSTELERSNKLMIGRELKMIELKEEIARLKAMIK